MTKLPLGDVLQAFLEDPDESLRQDALIKLVGFVSETNPVAFDSLQVGVSEAECTERLRAARTRLVQHDAWQGVALLLRIEAAILLPNDEAQFSFWELASVQAQELFDDAAAQLTLERAGSLFDLPDAQKAQSIGIETRRKSGKTALRELKKMVQDGTTRELSLDAARSRSEVLSVALTAPAKDRPAAFAAAAALLTEALLVAPQEPRLLRAYAAVAQLRGESLAAAQTLARVPRAELRGSKALIAAGALHEARILLQSARNRDPESLALLTRLRRLLSDPADDEAAMLLDEELGKRSDATEDQRVGSWLQVAMWSWKTRGDLARARLAFGELERLAPKHPAALAFRAAFKESSDMDIVFSEASSPRMADLFRAVQGGSKDALLTRELEGLLRSERRVDDLRKLYALQLEEANTAKKVDVLSEWADYEEDVVGDAKRACALHEELLAIVPQRGKTLRALSRLYASLGEGEKAIAVLERDRDQREGEERAAREIAISRCYLGILRNPREAIKAAVRAVELSPGSIDAIRILEELLSHAEVRPQAAALLDGLFERGGERERRLPVLEIRCQTQASARDAEELFITLSELYRDLSRIEDGYRTTYRGVRECPNSLPLWALYESFARASSRTSEFAETLDVALAEPGAIPDAAASTLAAKLADLWAELGDEGRAVPLLLRELRKQPTDHDTFDRVKAELTAREQWTSLSEAYDLVIAQAGPEQRCEWLTEVAILREELAGDLAGATRAYELLLAENPGLADARYALEKLYERTGKDSELAELLVARAAEEPNAAKLLATLLDRKLSRTRDAVPYYARALGVDASVAERLFEIAKLGIERESIADALSVYYATIDYRDGLLATEELRLAIQSEGPQLRDVLRRMLALTQQEPRLISYEFEVLTRLVLLEPADVDLRTDFAAFATISVRRATIAEVLDRTERLAEPAARAGIQLVLAALFEDGEGDRAKAELALNRVLANEHASVTERSATFDALERIAGRAGDTAALASVLLLRASNESHDVAVELLSRVGDLADEAGAPMRAQALAAYRGILVNEPTHEKALAALAHWLDPETDAAELCSVLAARADLLADPKEVQDTRTRLADLYRLRGETALAADQWSLVIEMGEDSSEPLREKLVAALESLGRVDDEAAEIQNWLGQNPNEIVRVSLLARLGVLCTKSESNLPKALAAYEELLELQPTHRAVRLAVADFLSRAELRLDAANVWLRAVERGGFQQDVAAPSAPIGQSGPIGSRGDAMLASDEQATFMTALAVRAELSSDDEQRDRDLRAIEARLGNAPSDYAFAVTRRGVHNAIARDEALLFWMTRHEARAPGGALQAASEFEGLAAQDTSDSTKAVLLMRGAVLRRGAGDLEGAGKVLERVVESSDDPSAYALLTEVYEEQGDKKRLATHLGRAAAVAETEGQRAQLLRRRGLCLAALGGEEDGEGIESFEQSLDALWDSGTAEQLFDLLVKGGRFGDALALLERELAHPDTNVAQRIALYTKLGDLAHQAVGDSERALDAYDAGLALESQGSSVRPGAMNEGAGAADAQPGPAASVLAQRVAQLITDHDVGERAFDILDALYTRNGNEAERANIRELRLDAPLDEENASALLWELSALYEDKLRAPERALDALGRLIRRNMEDVNARSGAERIASHFRLERALAEVLEAAIEPDRIASTSAAAIGLRAAELYLAVLDIPRARRLLEEHWAFEGFDGSAPSGSALESLLVRDHHWTDLRLHYERRLENNPDDSRVMRALADLYEQELGDIGHARALWEKLFAADSDDVAARDALIRCVEHTRDFAGLAQLYGSLADQASDELLAAEWQCKRGHVFATLLDEPAHALESFDAVLGKVPASSVLALQATRGIEPLLAREAVFGRASAILDSAYEAQGNLAGLYALEEMRLARASSPATTAVALRALGHLELRIGEANGTQTQAATAAFARFAAALRLEPNDEETASECETSALASAAFDALVALFEQVTAAPEVSSATQVRLWRALARVHDVNRGDLREALACWCKLHAVVHDDAEGLAAIEQYATLLSDWDALEKVYSHQAEHALTAEDRARAHRLIGELRRDMKDDGASAIPAFEAALSEEPSSAFTQDLLIGLYEEHFPEDPRLEQLYSARISLIDEVAVPSDDPDRLADLLLSHGAILAKNQAGHAIEKYERFLSIAAEHPTLPRIEEATLALSVLYRGEARYGDLCANLEARLTRRFGVRAELLAELAEVCHVHSADDDRARGAYQEALTLAFRADWAHALLELFTEESGETIAALLEPRVHAFEDSELRMRLLDCILTLPHAPAERIGTLRQKGILAERQGAFELAASTWREALVLAPEVDLWEGAARAAMSAGTDAVKALQAVVLASLKAPLEPAAKKGMLLAALTPVRDSVSLAEAVVLVDAGLKAVADDEDLVSARASLAALSGNDDELPTWLRKLETVTRSEDGKADVQFRLGAALKVKHPAESARAIVTSLQHKPDSGKALTALEAFCFEPMQSASDGVPLSVNERTTSESPEAVAAFRIASDALFARYRAASDVPMEARLWMRCASMLPTQEERRSALLAHAQLVRVSEPNQALLSLQRAYAIRLASADDIAALVELAPRNVVSVALAELDQSAKAQQPEGRVRSELRRAIAVATATHGSDPVLARGRLSEILGEDAGYEDAHASLADLLRAAGEPAMLARALDAYAAVASDSSTRRALVREAIVAAEQSARDLALATQIAGAEQRRDPADVWIAAELVRLVEAQAKPTAALLEILAALESDSYAQETTLVRAAQAHALEGSEMDAGRIYQGLYTRGQNDPLIALPLAAWQNKEGRNSEALAVLQRAIDAAAQADSRRTMRLALLALSPNEERARATLQAMLLDDSRDAEARTRRLALLEQTSDTPALIAAIEREAEIADEDVRVIDSAAWLAKAANVAEKMTDGRAVATALWARAYERARLDDAIAERFEQSLLAENRLAEADAVLVERIAHAPHTARTAQLESLAALREKRDEWASAASALADAVALSPLRADLQSRLEQLLIRTSNWDALALHYEARALLVGGPAATPLVGASMLPPSGTTTDSVKLSLAAAEVHSAKRENYTDAIRVLEAVLTLMPDHRETLLALADAHLAAGRANDAVAVLERTAKGFGARRTKELAAVHRRLSTAYGTLGDGARALTELDTAFKIDPSNIEVLRDLGVLALNSGDLEKAQKSFRALLLQKLDDGAVISKALVFQYLGDICVAQNDTAKATQMYGRALENDPALAHSRDALAKLRL